MGPNFHPFRSTVRGFEDKHYLDMRDLEITLKGQMWFSAPRHISYDIVYPTGPKFPSDTVSGFGDKHYLDMRDLDMTLKGQMWFSTPRHISYDIVYPTEPKFPSVSLYGERFFKYTLF